MENRILGCLLGAAIGDAMGAPTEMRTKKQIEDFFDGPVTTFIAPPTDVFARGNAPGEVTDDFSMAYLTCQAIIEQDYVINKQVAIDALLKWSENEKYFEQFVGPTSRAAIDRLKGKSTTALEYDWLCADNTKATNGAAMKMSPISLFAHGDVDRAIEIAVEVASATHDNNIAISGAAAVAAATNMAIQQGTTLLDIVNAACYGAKKGDEIARRKFKTITGPSVEKKIKLAVSIALSDLNAEDTMIELADVIGNSAKVYETVPIAIGLIVANNGDLMTSIIGGVNVGYDTDSIATIIGGILGAFHGARAFPEDYLSLIEQANKYDLKKLAKKITGLNQSSKEEI